MAGGEIPVITLWQPWAQMIEFGYKTIETRRHQRFAKLVGQRVGIHAGKKWDSAWSYWAHYWLTPQQRDRISKLIGSVYEGMILCTANVVEHRELNPLDEPQALIECTHTQRWGLVLNDIQPVVGKFAKGKQGIWYADI